MRNYKVIETDVLIIGTEGAGARAAIEARRQGLEVLAVSKLYQGRSGSTICAPGDYSCDSKSLREMALTDTDPADTVETFYEDISAGGKQISHPVLARMMAEQAPARLQDLIAYGAKFTKAFHYGGHRFPRGAAVGRVGKTGVGVMQALGRTAKESGARLLQGCMVLELLVNGGQACGAVGLDLATGELFVFRAKSVIMATGGAARAFRVTSNPEEQTGDGMGMAYRAGVEMVDMEMMQFIPYAQAAPTAMAGNIHFAYELVSLLPSYLLNSDGERFMAKYDAAKMEKSTRDYLCIGIASEVAAGKGSEHGGAYVALSHIDPGTVKAFADEMFPNWQVGAFSLPKFGFDPASTAVEITPASHYSCGGIRINERCETNLPGLYAAGEVAGGVHGANRLSGNALTETQVFGYVAGCEAGGFAARCSTLADVPWEQVERVAAEVDGVMNAAGSRQVWEVRNELYDVSQELVGVLRDGQSLARSLDRLHSLAVEARSGIRLRTRERRANEELQKALESLNIVEVLEMTARSAIERKESRGAHFRHDYAQMDEHPANTFLVREGDRARIWQEPVPVN